MSDFIPKDYEGTVHIGSQNEKGKAACGQDLSSMTCHLGGHKQVSCPVCRTFVVPCYTYIETWAKEMEEK